MTDQERKVAQFLEDNREQEPWDYVEKTEAVMVRGEVVAVFETMACGDCIATFGDSYL